MTRKYLCVAMVLGGPMKESFNPKGVAIHRLISAILGGSSQVAFILCRLS